jgi:serine/threonine protein kinase
MTASPRSDVVLTPGARPLPEYELLRRLGRGGFGEVWQARGPGGFDVALKFILLGEQEAAVEQRALDLMKSLRHAHLLPLFGAWQSQGFLIVAMELADGTLLGRCNEAIRSGLPGIPEAELLGNMAEAAKGLDFLNGQDVQHRDVKPQNLLLVGGSVKVADFGLAKILEQTRASASGSLTPAYAPPELFTHQVTRWSDQYSLAVSYCQLRGGRLPFSGNPVQLLYAHLHQAPDLSMLPTEAERAAVARALSKTPETRWPNCQTFAAQLAAAEPARQPAVASLAPGGPDQRREEAAGGSSTASLDPPFGSPSAETGSQSNHTAAGNEQRTAEAPLERGAEQPLPSLWPGWALLSWAIAGSLYLLCGVVANIQAGSPLETNARVANVIACSSGILGLWAVISLYVFMQAKQRAAAKIVSKLGFKIGLNPSGVSVVKVDLSGARVGDEWLSNLRPLLPYLEELDLHGCHLFTDVGMARLDEIWKPLSRPLETLNLEGTQVSDRGLAIVKAFTNLKTLRLSGAQVTDTGLAHLQALTKLQTLYLSGIQVTDAGLAHLQALTKLQTLHLSSTQVTDAGLAHLKALTKLKTLHLGGAQVTDGGVKDLQMALLHLEVHR